MYINKKLLFVHFTVYILLLVAYKTQSQNGRLDETFGNKGVVTTAINLDKSNSEALAVKIQSDGKIVAGGYYYNENKDYDFAIARYNTDGLLDNSFGTNGIVIIPVSSGYDEINSIVIQTDPADGNIEKIIAAGFTQNSNDTDFVLVRINDNGSLDSTFGKDRNGIVMSGMKNFADYATSIALANDGKVVVAGYQYNGHDFDFLTARYSADGIPDSSFGNINGILTTEVSGRGTDDRAFSIAIQNDGDIIAAGSSDEENNFAVVRYKYNGSLDASFGRGGIAETSVGIQGLPRNINAFSIGIQRDDKIIIGGRSFNENINDFTLLRYKSNGELDSTFNGNGIVVTKLQNNSEIRSIFINSNEENEKITAAGSSFNGLDIDITLARYNSNGSLDNSFGTGGIIIIPISKSDQTAFAADYLVNSVDGKIERIVTAGYSYDGSSIDFAIASFNGEGIIDKNFGTNGIINTQIENTHSILNAIAVQPSEHGEEKIIAAGYTGKGDNSFMTIVRYNPDGKPDNSFGTNGKGIVIIPVPKPESIRALLIQNDGKIIAVAYSTLVRFSRDGIVDTLFGVKGIVNLPITATDETNHSAAIQDDGKIVVSGGFYNGSDFDYAVVRIDSSGNLDPDFGTMGDGLIVTPIGTSTDFANSLAIQKDGKIVVAGDYRFSPNKLDIALVRYDSNGILDSTFGINGIVKFSVGSANDNILSAAIQEDGKIIIAGSSGGFDNYDFTLLRFNPNGSIDSTFGTNGIVTTPIVNEDDIAVALAITKDKIVAAGNSFIDNYENFVLARYDPDGNLDKTFGQNGIVIMHFGSSSSGASSVLIQGDGKIVIGGSSNSKSTDYIVFTLVRFNDNVATEVKENSSGRKSTAFKLEQNYPNPFNPATKIKYTIPFTSKGNSGQTALPVQMKVYNILGEEVAVLVNKEQHPGDYEISFNAKSLSSGIYFYRLDAGDFHTVKKMILMK